MSADEYVYVTVQVHHQTDSAVLISDTGDEESAVWIPYSQIEDGKAGVTTNGRNIAIIGVKEWIAKEKGLI